ncbi:hypothetical protein PSHT_03920 [Puccinia striiformis]|uniref:Uncharacterized protein n=2 Tax=Puccinia striiformis TaxID=27350 RepID=A0A2S4WEF0_9BASI|nr:hypothetical protein PSTT_10383 [Puccinia striiformis]POW20119.1 hypothetical protein PSHT_03920 [Puccinia striiformis]
MHYREECRVICARCGSSFQSGDLYWHHQSGGVSGCRLPCWFTCCCLDGVHWHSSSRQSCCGSSKHRSCWSWATWYCTFRGWMGVIQELHGAVLNQQRHQYR